MGNRFSKKCYSSHSLSNSHVIFSPYKLVIENRDAYNEKEHLGHTLLREIFNGNFSSNIQDILLSSNSKVLDVGCGSGFWLMEMAADFRKPRYFGIDMLPVFPKSTFPSNIEFLQHNFLEGLPYEDNTFDFIHMQFLACDFTESQWETFVYQELERVLKPGGWLEICDPEYEFLNSGPTTERLNFAVRDNLMSRNYNPFIIKRHHSLIKSIPSFSSSTIYHEKRNFPLGSFESKLGKLGGQYFKENWRYILNGPIGRIMNVKKKDASSMSEKIASEFESYNTYLYIHKFYVQKE